MSNLCCQIEAVCINKQNKLERQDKFVNWPMIYFFLFQTIGKAFCYFNGFINTLFAMASVLTICSLCVYQYVSVVLPMNKSLTNFRCLVMVLCAWVISIFFATGPAIHWGRYEFTSNIFNCEYYHTTDKAEISYNITMMFCGYLFPCTFTSAFCERCTNIKCAWQ